MATFDNISVTGDVAINRHLQVLGGTTLQDVNSQNQTIQQSLNVNGSQTIAGHLQVNGSATIVQHLGAGQSLSANENVVAGSKLMSLGVPAVPPVSAAPSGVNFYNATNSGQPGLVLKGTDGNNYVLFIDVSSGTPTIGIHRV